MTSPTKNPKDAAASNRLPMGSVVPSSLTAFAALAFAEGAAKYSAFNYRRAPVAFMVYVDAMLRHLALLTNGEWQDPRTGVPHISSILAGAGILADTHLQGTLIDDRPPANPALCEFIRASEKDVERIRALFAKPEPESARDDRPEAPTCLGGSQWSYETPPPFPPGTPIEREGDFK